MRIKNQIKNLKEQVLWGGKFREFVLIKALLKYYKSRIYRDWSLSKEQPHFFDQRAGLFQVAFGEKSPGFYGYSRGFFAAEIIEEGDILLDIGTGDGFFAKRFFAAKAGWIDAIDIEPTAITAAHTFNRHAKINYILMDATTDPFPREQYDIIVWDGAIGHFNPDTITLMLKKIKRYLKPDGIFAGSESLGVEGHDHLQYFMNLESLSSLFKPYFEFIEVKAARYEIPGMNRTEGYWRCSNSDKRLKAASWKRF
jgi:SAM-dependent methyltransferase